MFKILIDGQGALLSVTMKKRAYFIFLSRPFVGGKVSPTTDPFPGIVEICGYDIGEIVRNWDRLFRIKIS
jgi:hypothetical protein